VSVLAQRYGAACLLASLGLPSLARACPMCFSGGGANDGAFFWGSVFMIVVPLAVLGTLGYLAIRRIRVVDESNARALRQAPQGPRPAPDSRPLKQT
jgi:hypothetical protein